MAELTHRVLWKNGVRYGSEWEELEIDETNFTGDVTFKNNKDGTCEIRGKLKPLVDKDSYETISLFKLPSQFNYNNLNNLSLLYADGANPYDNPNDYTGRAVGGIRFLKETDGYLVGSIGPYGIKFKPSSMPNYRVFVNLTINITKK